MRLLAAAACVTLLACGPVNPGSDGGSPDASLDAGSDAGTDAGVSVCVPEFRRCGKQLYLPFVNELRVDVRGSWDGWTTSVPMQHVGVLWTATVPLPWNTEVQYKFIVNGSDWRVNPMEPTRTDATGNTNNVAAPLTCDPYTCDLPTPTPPGVFDWRDAVIYFVFVDRFLDGDLTNDLPTPSGVQRPAAYQGGDWKGVTQRITEGYFTDLGVNTLWLTVPFQNADTFAGPGLYDANLYTSYHGYWPTEVGQPERGFGTLAELKALVDAAHARGIKVLFDYAMVHVHDSATVYQQHMDWFWPNSFGTGNCICGQGCDWNAQGDRCWFASYLPHWNYTNDAARAWSVAQAVQWVKDTGVDGYRLDAIKHIDSRWMVDLRARLDAEVLATQSPRQRFYMVGETYDFYNQAYLKSFIDPATKLDGQFDFPLRRVVAEAMLLRTTGLDGLKAFMDGNDQYYGPNAVMSTWLGNHDLPRAIHLAEEPPVWSDQSNGGTDRSWNNPPGLPGSRKPFEKLANAYAVLLTNRGAPLVYYGDEVGLPGAGDPDNRRPMQWTGYSADQLYLRERLKTLLKIRAAHPALRRGVRVTLQVDGDFWLYRMVAPEEELIVALNRGDADRQTTMLPSTPFQELVTAQSVSGPSATIPARQVRIFAAP